VTKIEYDTRRGGSLPRCAKSARQRHDRHGEGRAAIRHTAFSFCAKQYTIEVVLYREHVFSIASSLKTTFVDLRTRAVDHSIVGKPADREFLTEQFAP